MGKGMRICLLALALLFGAGLRAGEDIRILKLFPDLEHPPLVDPCLPKDFTIGYREDDPSYKQGYYWGNSNTLETYFQNPSSLNACLICAKISSNVSQIGLDRFTLDGKTNDLTALGFTEIIINRGRWGILPFRDMQAKGPKGRYHYQMWVGLNDGKGTVMHFQFLYPDYLNEPTQNQKKIWKDFVKKTSFLSLEDLLVIRELTGSEKNKYVSFAVEKRQSDNKFFIQAKPHAQDFHIEVQNVKDLNALTGHFERPCLEISFLVLLNDNTIIEDTVQVEYKVLERFSFSGLMLNLNSFEDHPDYLLLFK